MQLTQQSNKNAVEFARKYDNVHTYMLTNPLQMYTDFHAPTQSRAEQKQSKNTLRSIPKFLAFSDYLYILNYCPGWIWTSISTPV